MEMGRMRYKVDERESCLIGGAWVRGWVVQIFTGREWMDVTRPYDTEGDALYVMSVLER